MTMTTSEIAICYVFESESRPGKTYQCLLYVNGTTSCDCKGWTMKRANVPRSCRHTRLVEAGLAETHCVSRVQYNAPRTRTAPGIQAEQPSMSLPEPRRGRKFALSL